MVDEAILALGSYAVPDPLDVFYAPRRSFMQDQHNRRWVVHWPHSAGPGTLSGTVLDEGGRPARGVTVRLEGTTLDTTTAFDGSFTLRGVPPGEHVLVLRGPNGFSGRRVVTVPAGGAHVGNLILGPFGIGGDGRAVEMTGELAAVAAAPAPLPAPRMLEPQLRLESLVVARQDAAAEDLSVRADFAPLAFFEPSLRTDADGRVRVTARLPASLTRYRVMAVAVAGAERYGTGEAAVTARQDLVVRITAPRFLNAGDRFELPVLVHNTTSRTLDIEIAARAAGLELAGAAGRRIVLPAGVRAEVRFDAVAPRAGAAHVQVAAAAVGANAPADAAAATIPVRTPATRETFAIHGSVDDHDAIVLPLARPRGVLEEVGGLEVNVAATALQSLTDAVLYLHAYPFEGAEHIASRVLAVAALRDVLTAFAAEGLPPAEALAAATQRDIAELATRQMPDGGWPMWRAAAPSHPFVSIHVAHALQRAQERGFDVPPAVLQRAREYLRRIDGQLGSWPLAARQGANAYALYVRHRLGDEAAMSEARQRAAAAPTRVGGELPIEAAAWLLHVLAADPAASVQADELRRTLANRLVETAGTATFAERYDDGAHLLLHSRRRTDAVVLEALIAADGDADVVTKLASALLANRVAGRWSGTQENAWVLLALDRYFRTYEATTPAFAARVWVGERFAGGHTFEGRTTERRHIAIPMPELLRMDAAELVISREGAGRMYYRAGLSYAPADPRVPATDRGFTISRSYEPVDDPADVARDEDGTWRVRAGARVRVVLNIIAPSVRYHAAVVDPLPAGFEPLNTELQGTGFTDEPSPRPPGAPPDAPVRSMPATMRPAGGVAPPWRPGWFEHQNLRDDRAEAFASLLPAGVYEYSYLVRATTPGTFVAPPPRAEMMYEPETFGRGAGAIVVVEPRPER
jgi:alpha-2-macroglobulin